MNHLSFGGKRMTIIYRNDLNGMMNIRGTNYSNYAYSFQKKLFCFSKSKNACVTDVTDKI